MSKKIDSRMMDRAVALLFDNEVIRNGRVSSHSQLERWIVEELKMYSAPSSAKALQLVLLDLRDIKFEIEDGGIDAEIEAEVRLRTEYTTYDFHKEDTGGGCTSLTRHNSDSKSYVMVTIADSCDAPDNLLDRVSMGMYDGGGNLLFDETYISSFEMFGSDLFKWIISTQ